MTAGAYNKLSAEQLHNKKKSHFKEECLCSLYTCSTQTQHSHLM